MSIFNFLLPDENLLIGKVVNVADALHSTYGICNSQCNHPWLGKCPGNIVGSCLKCSEEVHWQRSERRVSCRAGYNCQKMIYYYVCRYSWKYCSEIMYALECVDLSKYGEYKVSSLGCGATPDLMALEQLIRGDENKKIVSYVGMDINPLWQNVHSEIKNYCSQNNINCSLEIEDALDYVNFRKFGIFGFYPAPNMIFISYLLSSFPDSKREEYAEKLLDLIINKILIHNKGKKYTLIVFNDIDKSSIRQFFNIFLKKLQQNGYNVQCTKKHFKDRNQDYGDGSVQHESDNNKFNIPPDLRKSEYNLAIKCSSAQLIIEVI